MTYLSALSLAINRPQLSGSGGAGSMIFDSSVNLSPILYENSDRRVRLVSGTSFLSKTAKSLIAKSGGKWYFEFAITDIITPVSGTTGVGVAETAFSFTTNQLSAGGTTAGSIWPNTGTDCNFWTSGSPTAYTPPMLEGSRIMIALDIDNLKLFTGANGTWHNSGNPVAGTGQVWTIPSGKTWHAAVTPWTAGPGDVVIDLKSSVSDCLYALPTGFSYWP